MEAFPNAFLGVLVAVSDYQTLRVSRREKTEALLDRVRRGGALREMRGRLGWDDESFWNQLAENQQHDETAALVCALTAICVARGFYTAVGDDIGGFFFLPTWDLWQPWAREQLCLNLERKNCSSAVPGDHVWVDGARA